MNTQPRAPDLVAFGDAVRPRAWTADEMLAMVRAGILRENDRIELIGGEIVAMAAKGARHEIIRNELVLWWADRRPRNVKFAEETPLRLSPYNEPEPDIILFPADLLVSDVKPDTVLLVVEIADSSLSYDLTIKAPLYASFGVVELWVVDTATLEVSVHTGPTAAGYREVRVVRPHETLTPTRVASLEVRIGDLGLQPN